MNISCVLVIDSGADRIYQYFILVEQTNTSIGIVDTLNWMNYIFFLIQV